MFLKIAGRYIAIAAITDVRVIATNKLIVHLSNNGPIEVGGNDAEVLTAWLDDHTEDTEYLSDPYQRRCR